MLKLTITREELEELDRSRSLDARVYIKQRLEEAGFDPDRIYEWTADPASGNTMFVQREKEEIEEDEEEED